LNPGILKVLAANYRAHFWSLPYPHVEFAQQFSGGGDESIKGRFQRSTHGDTHDTFPSNIQKNPLCLQRSGRDSSPRFQMDQNVPLGIDKGADSDGSLIGLSCPAATGNAKVKNMSMWFLNGMFIS
jgi:hypothetical protein